jgi:hypothetical protein
MWPSNPVSCSFSRNIHADTNIRRFSPRCRHTGNARESTAYTVICIDQGCRRSSYEDAARSLPKAGGTVGPLPDGTVIEVKSIDWPDLFIDGGPALFSESDILDAYNAKNLVPAILDTAPGRKQDERGTRGGSA